MLTQTDLPSWFREVVVLERETTEIREFQSILVPGLLQTEAYARSVLTARRMYDDADAIEALVKSRIDRREVLTGGNQRLAWFALDEMAIRREVGNPAIMRNQVSHLLEVAESRQARIVIIPARSPEHPGRTSPFRVMSFADRPAVAYVEHALGGELIDDPQRVGDLSTLFGALQSEALPMTSSIALLRKTLEGFDEQA